ncbi:MAG: M60 family metallopeptidase [Flavobacteriaceae bacterium]
MKTLFFKTKTWLYALLMVFIGVGLQSCNDDDTLESGKSEWLKVLPLELEFNASGGTQSVLLILTNDINVNDVTYAVSANGEDWCSVERNGKNLYVTVAQNYVETTRSTLVTVDYGIYSRQIPVSQTAAVGDQLIPVVSGTATTEQATDSDYFPFSYSYDGDTSTYFNSKFGAISDWPFQLIYTLEEGYTLDRIIYYPRSDAGNKWGSLNQYEVWASTTDAPDTFTKIGEYERGDANHNITVMKLDTPVENVAKVRFDIYSSYQSRVSCAEMEFYQAGTAGYDYTTIFEDDMYSVLKDGVTETQLKAIPDSEIRNMALDLLVNEYDTNFRAASYRPYQNPAIQSAINKTARYSLRDNPTGIYVEEGEELLVISGDTKGQDIQLIVQDLSVGFNSAKTYVIQQGENRLSMESGGLIYVQNLTDDDIPLILENDTDKAAAEEKTVNLHFVNAKVNGYFDLAKHSSSDWTTMLANAPYQDIDVLGTYAHITWTVEDFRSYNTDIASVITKYDRLVYLEQEFAGLEKYDKMFKNRMYLQIDYNGASPYATNYRTAYTSSYAELFCNASRFEARIWGPGHEVGHINQVRPAFRWAGTTEVTNNIMSVYVQTEFGETSKFLKDNDYAAARAAIIDANQPHCLENASNQFYIKTIPFWQLKLYLVDALGKEDFYRDLYEYFRVTADLDTSSTTQGVLQLDFVRQTCRISGLNLLDFFQKWGFLTAVDTTLNDYGNKPFKITQAQIDALITEINAAGYDTPAHTNIEFIQDDNVDDYK